MFDLKEKTDVPTAKLSKGMKAKLSLIKALIHDPAAVILDEPFNGLDPDSRISLKKTLVELRNKGKGILLSSHELFEVETLCDRVVLVDKGRVLADESIQNSERDSMTMECRLWNISIHPCGNLQRINNVAYDLNGLKRTHPTHNFLLQ
ncbi:MAG: AAA family ATPase [Bacteroidales bacterium]|nr:AAA family ATPase [Candidatus Latescibacterota bacterium]